MAKNLRQVFHDENKKLTSIFVQPNESINQIPISDRDRFLTLLEVDKKINSEEMTTEKFFGNDPKEISNGNVEMPLSFVLNASIISFGAGSFAERVFNKKSRSQQDEEVLEEEENDIVVI